MSEQKDRFKCPYNDCNAAYSTGPWLKGYSITVGTSNPVVHHNRKVPVNLCPICERDPKDYVKWSNQNTGN